MTATDNAANNQGFLSALKDVPGVVSGYESRWLPVVAGLVHKIRPEAVRASYWRPLSEDMFEVSVDWTHFHPIFSGGSAHSSDPVLVTESLRQCVVLVAHAAYDVPLGSAFVMNAISVELVSQQHTGPDLAGIIVTVRCCNVQRRGKGLQSMATSLTFRHRGRLIASGGGDLLVLPPPIYQRVRGGHVDPLTRVPGELVDPRLVGKRRVQDVLLSQEKSGWTVQADTSHPVLFDHPSDHLPGMLLIEAARQAARAEHPDLEPHALSAVFHRYAEFDPAPSLTVGRVGTRTVIAGLQQGSAPLCTVKFIAGPG